MPEDWKPESLCCVWLAPGRPALTTLAGEARRTEAWSTCRARETLGERAVEALERELRAEERRARARDLVIRGGRGAASAAGQAPCALQHLQQVDGEQGG